MGIINISSVTSVNLHERKLADVLPEYYKLEKFTENNTWHNHQNVFNHVVSVYENLEKLLKLKYFNKQEQKKLHKYLSEKIGKHSRENVLKMATLLHDFSKSETLIKNPDGTTKCPGHEEKSKDMVKLFSERFGLNDESRSYVERIVGYHGYISEVLGLMKIKKKDPKYLNEFKNKVGDVAIELLFLVYADDLGSDLPKTDKLLFEQRNNIIKFMFSDSIKSLEEF